MSIEKPDLLANAFEEEGFTTRIFCRSEQAWSNTIARAIRGCPRCGGSIAEMQVYMKKKQIELECKYLAPNRFGP